MSSLGKSVRRTAFCCRPDTSAVDIAIAGDFTEWRPVAMRRKRSGLYVAVFALRPGRYEYKFLIDGQWHTDAENDRWAVNPYGTLNSVTIVQQPLCGLQL